MIHPASAPSVGGDPPEPEWPPTPLIACALLWIGMAADRYLPGLWLNIAMTGMAVTVAVAIVCNRLAKRKRMPLPSDQPPTTGHR